MQTMTIRQQMRSDAARKWKLAKQHKVHYLFILPYALIFLCFFVLPVVISICLSFTDFNVLEMPHFVGISNYYKMFVNDDIFITSLQNTLLFAVITGPLGYLLSLVLAWLINDLPRIERVILTILFYAPSISGGMVTVWLALFSGDSHGFINGFLTQLGLIDSPIVFLTNKDYVVPIVLFVVLWMSLGTTFLSFIAGLQGVDRQYYEAAALDGIKNRWQELWFVTLPMMKPQLMFGAVISITSAFGIGDIVTQLVGNPSVDYVAHTLVLHLQDTGTVRYEMGYACAIATVLFLMMVGSNKLVQILLRKVGA